MKLSQQIWRPPSEAKQGQRVTEVMIEQGTEAEFVVVAEVVVVLGLLSLQKMRETAGLI